jgi:hypothetical protein
MSLLSSLPARSFKAGQLVGVSFFSVSFREIRVGNVWAGRF